MDGGLTGAGKSGKRVWEYSRGGQHRPDLHTLPWAIQGLSSGFHKSCSISGFYYRTAWQSIWRGKHRPDLTCIERHIADPAKLLRTTSSQLERLSMNSSSKKGRLTERSKPIDNSRNNLRLWKPGSKSSTSKEKMKLKSVETAVFEAIHRMSKSRWRRRCFSFSWKSRLCSFIIGL